MQYNIAPTDLTFLLNDCHACFWRKVKLKKPRPYTPFPSVFNAIDKAMRQAYSGGSTALIHESLEAGVLYTAERRIKSNPILVPGRTSTIVFSGRVDAIAFFSNKTVGVLDFKTSTPKDENIALYSRQLHCYRTIIENLDKGELQIVSKLGIVCENPGEMEVTNGKCHRLEMEMTYIPIPINDDWWLGFLKEILDILDGAEPPSSPKCHYCDAYRWQQLQATGLKIDLGVPNA